MMNEDKINKIKGLIAMNIFQTIFFASVFLNIYWILTFNWFWLGLSAGIVLLQSFINGGWAPYYNFVTDIMKAHQFFPSTRQYQQPVPHDENTMFSMHPHSIFTYGMHSNLHNPRYPNQKFSNMIPLGSRFILNLPVIGVHFKLWGLQSVDPQNLKRLMKQKKTIGLIPGGYEQATLTTPKQLRVYINNRKGFIKYALKYGYTIRPVLFLNEHQMLYTFDGLQKLRLLLNKIKIPATYYWSKYGIFFPPFQHFHTIIGPGLKGSRTYAQNENPTQQQIDNLHQKYIETLEALYEKHKQKNNGLSLKIY